MLLECIKEEMVGWSIFIFMRVLLDYSIKKDLFLQMLQFQNGTL